MKGQCVIEINYATLVDALQQYLNTKLVEKPVILDINSNSSIIYSQGGSLKITVQENGSFLQGEK